MTRPVRRSPTFLRPRTCRCSPTPSRPSRVCLKRGFATGKYTVKYRVDFQDGHPPTEGVTDLVVTPEIAKAINSRKKPE